MDRVVLSTIFLLRRADADEPVSSLSTSLDAKGSYPSNFRHRLHLYLHNLHSPRYHRLSPSVPGLGGVGTYSTGYRLFRAHGASDVDPRTPVQQSP